MRFEEERRGILSDIRQLNIETKILKFSDFTSVGIGGEPYSFVFPRNMSALEKIIEYVKSKDIPFCVVGNGTKMLVRDGKIPCLVISLIRFDFQNCTEEKDSFYLKVGTGTSLQFLVALGIKKGFEGVEKIAGIPGCVGGAVKVNAGTRLGWISDFVEDVEVLTLSDGNFWIEKIKPEFGYRWSSIKDNQIVLSVSMRFKKTKPTEVRDKVSRYLKKRFETQPVNSKTFGCIFKNPPNGESAGKIIDELGLKGFRLTKRIKISSIHANFLENEGGACFQEAEELINYIKEKVKQERKIELEEEVIKLCD
jgi:UDP-N-acetylmuramate dehydrogenase